MAYFGTEGLAGSFAAGAARGGSHRAESTAAGGNYASNTPATETKAPYIAATLLPPKAGDGQRFPFPIRTVNG